MIVPDVNLLLYSVIDGFPQHDKAKRWLDAALNGTDSFGLTSPAIFGFVRLSTSARVLTTPLPVDLAAGYVRGWLARPNSQLLVPGPRHLEIAFELLSQVGTGANLTTDAQIAAFAVEHGGDVHSNDADFQRFSGVRWVNPLLN